MLEIGSLVDGKYKVLNEIGHGGMSVVYLALNERANKTWAIKEVRKTGASNYEVVKQGLIAETNILKRLNHPRLPSIIDVIDHDDTFLIVMDYVEGTSLEKRLKNGPQPWQDVVEWGKQLCDVLAYLHSRNPAIIYRDMKPANVMLKPDGNVVLLDFGTAREYKSQRAGDDTTCLGTRGYAAPEQYGGMGQTDARTDIYCLGATMYHLVTGHNPSMPPYEIKPIRSINPKLPRGLEKIILKCTRTDPAQRYQSCAELMYDLENINKIDERYIRKQKKQLHTWIACAALTIAFAIAGTGFSVAANRNSSAGYESAIADPLGSFTFNMKSDTSSYTEIEEGFKEAISIEPANQRAWIYLTKLYRSDHVITNHEWSSMQEMLRSDTGKALQKNKEAYAQFCMEWGQDLFFFYDGSEDIEVGSGDPNKALTFLSYIIDEDDSRLLEYEASSKEKSYPESLRINDISSSVAEAEMHLAKDMYTIAEQWGNGLEQNSSIDKTYDYGSYWNDLMQLAKDDELLQVSSTGGSVNGQYIQSALYTYLISTVNQNVTKFKRYGITKDQMTELVDLIESRTRELKSKNPSEDIRTLIQNIETQTDYVRSSIKAM